MRFPSFTLTAKQVTVDVNESPLFAPADISIGNGQALIIKGENGVGKTTLLRVLAGLQGHSQGEIDFTGSEVSGHYLGHSNGLKAAQTVRQNLTFWSQFHGADGKPKILDAANQLDISHLLDLPTKVLSAGQKRRVAFAKLLCAPKALWILDEPSAALDSASDAKIQMLCAEHIERGGAVIAATHLPFLSPETYAFAETLTIERYLHDTSMSGEGAA